MLYHIGRLNNSLSIWVVQLLSIGMIGAASIDLLQELTGGKTKDSPIEWMAFIATFTIIFYKVFKRVWKY